MLFVSKSSSIVTDRMSQLKVKLTCDYCGKGYIYPKSLANHIESDHARDSTSFVTTTTHTNHDNLSSTQCVLQSGHLDDNQKKSEIVRLPNVSNYATAFGNPAISSTSANSTKALQNCCSIPSEASLETKQGRLLCPICKNKNKSFCNYNNFITHFNKYHSSSSSSLSTNSSKIKNISNSQHFSSFQKNFTNYYLIICLLNYYLK